MAEFKIKTKDDDKANIERLGRVEYDRRLAVVETKLKKLRWNEVRVYRANFQVLAMACNEDGMAGLEKLTAKGWIKTLLKILSKD